ncbi:MAG: 16S rRNA (uracil(1498)-N(3))-methyltransferase [Lachnospiraceae bacterium]
MYHFFVTPDQIGTETITITGPDENVLRMKPGEQVKISNGTDKDYHCRLSEITAEAVRAEILAVEEGGTELRSKLYLFQGLPKSDKMELIIQKAVELGVYEIVPVAAKRAVVRLEGKKEEAKVKRWNAISESAAKQSGRMVIPKVTSVMSFSEALSYAASCDKCLIPYEHAEGMAGTKRELEAIKPGMSVGIFIGPEGGFDDSEIRKAEEQGAVPITLGKRILRTETAGMTTLSILMFQLSE